MSNLEYVQDAFLIVVFILNGVGAFIKGIPKIPNWIIPIILLVLGVGAGIGVYGVTFEGITQGAVAGLASVGVHQTVTQAAARNK